MNGYIFVIDLGPALFRGLGGEGMANANQTVRTNFWLDVDDGYGDPSVWRMRERIFVGEATLFPGSRLSPVAQGSWLTSNTGANWAIRDAQVAVIASNGGLALVGYSQTSDNDAVALSASAIGVAGLVRANSGGTRSGWAGYFDVQYESGYAGYGIEIAQKNKSGVSLTSTPYLSLAGTVGIWLNTGDNSYGGAATNNNNSAVQVGRGGSGKTWNKGIVFYGDALTRDGFGRGYAIDLGKYHHVQWYTESNTPAFYVTSGVTDSLKGASLVVINDVVRFGRGLDGSELCSILTLSATTASIRLQLPTSSAGLSAGSMWNNNGVVNVV